MTTISGAEYIDGGIFDFTEGGYTPPTWSGSTYSFGAGVLGTINQIWTDSNYVYTATTQELAIVSIETEQKYAYINQPSNTVWANDDRVFIGTTNGIKYFFKTCISGSATEAYDISPCLRTHNLKYGVLSSDIKYLHGYSDNWLAICTLSGIDIYKPEPQGYRSTASIDGVQKCFMTSTGKFYYTVSGTEWSLNRVDSPTMDWTTPDKSYIAGAEIFSGGLSINAIFVTEGTATDTINNVLFTATSSGIYAIEEGTELHNIYYTIL